MPFTIDVDLIENNKVSLTENNNSNLDITHVPTGNTFTVDADAATSEIGGVDAEDSGTTVVSGTSAINFGTNLGVTDDTDGTVTVDVTGSLGSFSDDDSDNIAELGSSFTGAELGDDIELNFGSGADDTSIRYDSTNDDLRVADERNTVDRLTLDRSTGDLSITGELTEGASL